MQFHNVKPTISRKAKKRVGRGGKRGTYSGHGIKGQKSRAGHRIRPAFRDVLKKIPKRRGSGKHSRQIALGRSWAVVNLDTLEKNFGAGATITPTALFDKKLIGKISGKIPDVKILGRGGVGKTFIIKGCFVSKSAAAAIKKSGGVV
ncbi:uL15 family ribosomal protein [Candidatus Giovannonibacteria bacterium]|nr:uL15 family ribosomal protein [Candidatus Giovannonibacteria bacterium]